MHFFWRSTIAPGPLAGNTILYQFRQNIGNNWRFMMCLQRVICIYIYIYITFSKSRQAPGSRIAPLDIMMNPNNDRKVCWKGATFGWEDFVCLLVCVFVYLFVCIFVCLFIYLFVYLFVCMFVFLLSWQAAAPHLESSEDFLSFCLSFFLSF